MSDAKSILLIDGHDKDREYYAHRLKASSPYTILEAATGQAGLDLYKSHPIDCVILELHLPDKSGFEILIKLVQRPRRPVLPVVVLTVFTHEGLLEVARRNGALAILQKSTTGDDELERVVHKVMATIPRDGKKDVAAAPSNPFLHIHTGKGFV